MYIHEYIYTYICQVRPEAPASPREVTRGCVHTAQRGGFDEALVRQAGGIQLLPYKHKTRLPAICEVQHKRGSSLHRTQTSKIRTHQWYLTFWQLIFFYLFISCTSHSINTSWNIKSVNHNSKYYRANKNSISYETALPSDKFSGGPHSPYIAPKLFHAKPEWLDLPLAYRNQGSSGYVSYALSYIRRETSRTIRDVFSYWQESCSHDPMREDLTYVMSFPRLRPCSCRWLSTRLW